MTSNVIETDDDEYQNGYEDEEEEELSVTDDEQNELSDLQVDANMPLDELFKLYSNNVPTINNDVVQDDEESYSSSDVEDEDDDEDEDNRRHRSLHINGELLPENDDDDDDTDDSLYEPDIAKPIHVGDEYQVEIKSKAEYDSSNERDDDREVPVDELLWSSSSVNDSENENIDEYLKIIRSEYPASDDEISLQILLNCHLNTELALMKFRQLATKTIYSYTAWPLTEIQKFEEGLREYGKNFFEISTYKCTNRSVREVVHFYYQWKKSERYQFFIEEQQRINSLNSVSDIIEKFIEEQEHNLCTAAGVLNSENSPSFVSNDFKFHAPLSSNSSISFVTIHQQETTATTTKRSYDHIDNDDEPSTKKTSITTKTSSVEATATII
ncbi:unnamed protein product [Rotaria magnacalcarata]|uniref:Mesoderm induction early response protein 1 n=1 Tax=Rotaria magnacalcarata TaxID=392030 RepID=A0A816MXT6_9BILA|nr:unnamed protein product [Rotaria magnacalcarata]CAF2251432.1 unnamed protein product [Rotaria magnacalcarata]CAF3751141.1 unnamed protein product [Rotaria magnacalcarata]CAF3829701.1 unnamed protein product [Rotaria magnacalcarata]